MKLKINLFLFAIATLVCCQKPEKSERIEDKYQVIANEMEQSLRENLLETWYPKAVDVDSGGYFSNFTLDFQIKEDNQEKMIVTQARHLWSNAKASKSYSDKTHYANGCEAWF